MSVKLETNSSVVEAWFTQAASKQPEILRVWQDEGSRVVMETMRGFTPVRTGFLRESVTRAFSPDGFIVYPTARYAEYVEKGTGPRTIFPVKAKALRFEIEYGTVIFAKHVKHPGFPGRFYVQKTLETVKTEVVRIYREILERVFG